MKVKRRSINGDEMETFKEMQTTPALKAKTPKQHTERKLFSRPVNLPKSNKTLIRNALIQNCLAGTVNQSIKDQVLEVSKI